jgi:hypothetical protein
MCLIVTFVTIFSGITENNLKLSFFFIIKIAAFSLKKINLSSNLRDQIILKNAATVLYNLIKFFNYFRGGISDPDLVEIYRRLDAAVMKLATIGSL